MTINKEIKEIFKEFNIFYYDGVTYLLSLYFNLRPAFIPYELAQKVNATGIVYEDDTGLNWKIPLFEGQENNWEWIKTEYVPLFKQANPRKGGKVRESIARMKKLFAKNPEIRKEDVIGATKIYLNNTDKDYIRFPHYFIEKGVGANKTSDLLDWIDKYKEIQNKYNAVRSADRKLM